MLPLSLSYPAKGESVSLDLEDEMAMKSGSLSSTLRKLFIWEKKLLEEVKVRFFLFFLNVLLSLCSS